MLKKVRLRERTYNYSFRGKVQILFSIIQTFRRNFEEFKCDTVSASGFLFFFFFLVKLPKQSRLIFTTLLNVYLFLSLYSCFFFYKDLKPFTVILESKELMKQMSSYIYINIYMYVVFTPL